MTAQVELLGSLDAVAERAGAALSREARPCLFERLDWFRLVHEHTPPDGRLLALRAATGAASAWLFLGVDRGKAAPLSNWYSLRFGTILDGEDADGAAGALAAGLRRAGVSRILLSPLAADDPLAPALKRKGWVTRFSQSSVNWRIRTAGMSFEDYWASRPSRLRSTARRRAKAANLELRVHDRFDAGAWHDYETVYENSWKPSEGSPEFMRRLAEAEGEAGTLRLGLAYHEGEAVAAQLWLTERGIATIHKLAHREDAKHLSAGTLLGMEMFRRAIDEDKVEMIDFGTGDEPYKADWMSEAVPLYALSAFDPFSVGGLRGISRSAAAALVGRLRRR